MPELPGQHVTFPSPGIEGSTALWDRDRAAMREAVARQLAILQSLIAAHHGVLFKTVGHGTRSSIPSAEEALRAALASQRALLAEDWAEPSARSGCAWRCTPGRPSRMHKATTWQPR